MHTKGSRAGRRLSVRCNAPIRTYRGRFYRKEPCRITVISGRAALTTDALGFMHFLVIGDNAADQEAARDTETAGKSEEERQAAGPHSRQGV
jgi:hypothetical protein